jgi:hypothetical protein
MNDRQTTMAGFCLRNEGPLLSSQPLTTPFRHAANERSVPSGPAGALAGRGGLLASVGAALLGFGLAGVSAAGPVPWEPANRPAGAGAASPTPSDAANPAAAAQADAAARAAAARRADRASRSTSAPAKTGNPRPTAKPAPAWVHPMPGAEVTPATAPDGAPCTLASTSPNR